jgi:hypothetical protein
MAAALAGPPFFPPRFPNCAKYSRSASGIFCFAIPRTYTKPAHVVKVFRTTMCGMSETSGPKCVICGEAGKWFCAFCGSNCFCQDHACNHLARQYPDEFGVKSGPKEQERQEKQQTKKFALIAIGIVLLLLLLLWLWSQPGNGSTETMRVPLDTIYSSPLSLHAATSPLIGQHG